MDTQWVALIVISLQKTYHDFPFQPPLPHALRGKEQPQGTFCSLSSTPH